jgi:hypothetical protein
VQTLTETKSPLRGRERSKHGRRTFGPILFAVLAVVSSSTAVGAASVKAGGRCAAVGETATAKGRNLVCQKSGAKSVWVAQKAVAGGGPKPAYTGTFVISDASGKATGTMFWGVSIVGSNGSLYNDLVVAYDYVSADGSCTLSVPAQRGAGQFNVLENATRFRIAISLEGVAKCANGSTAPARLAARDSAPGLASALPFRTAPDVISGKDLSVGFLVNPDGATGSFTIDGGSRMEFSLKAATPDQRPAGVPAAAPVGGGG